MSENIHEYFTIYVVCQSFKKYDEHFIRISTFYHLFSLCGNRCEAYILFTLKTIESFTQTCDKMCHKKKCSQLCFTFENWRKKKKLKFHTKTYLILKHAMDWNWMKEKENMKMVFRSYIFHKHLLSITLSIYYG